MNFDNTLRYLTTRFVNIHVSGKKKDIAIFSSRRSGSTWLMEMISRFKGMKYITEPFNEEYIQYNRVLDQAYHQYISCTDAERDAIMAYLQNDRHSGFCGPVNPLKNTFRFFSSRRVLKATNANALLPMFADRGVFELIHLIRHPIPQIMSTRKYPYNSVLGCYVQDHEFMESNLSEGQRALAAEIHQSGSEWDGYMAGWCLDNLLPLRLVGTPGGKDLILLTYEDLVVNAAECVDHVARRFRLNSGDATGDLKESRPSWTTRFSSSDRVDAIQRGDRTYLVESWRDGDLSEFANFTEILEAFGISAYRIDSPFAEDSLRLGH